MKKQIKAKPLAVDFDGVIHKYSQGWADGAIYDGPMPGALEIMGELTKRGFGIIKPKASFYIDDRAIKFTDWPTLQKFFLS